MLEDYFTKKNDIPIHHIIIYRQINHLVNLFTLSYVFSTNLRQEIFLQIEELLQDIDERILLYSNAFDMFILLYTKDHYDCQVQSIDICIPIFSFLSYPLCQTNPNLHRIFLYNPSKGHLHIIWNSGDLKDEDLTKDSCNLNIIFLPLLER